MERIRMQRSIISLAFAASAVAFGCASFPVPVNDVALAKSSAQRATDVGAATQPNAQLHLELAKELMAQADAAMKDGDNARADGLLLRAIADADLAVAMVKDKSAKTGAQKAIQDSNAQTIVNANQGAVQ
jgi:hypothetical protein